jgi:transposase
VWISEHVRVVIEQVTGVQLTPSVVRRLLRERLGWSVQRRHERRPRRRPPPPTTELGRSSWPVSSTT